ncbi:hypothetical protein [Komagataeibacter phage phiKX1]|nr:hypothetical protein [Komagataeibacter phage phiKX1]
MAKHADSTIAINPQLMAGELRIKDEDLGARLGFTRPRDIRKIIARYLPELERMGVCATVSQTSGSKGGRPTDAYYLNRKQAIFITAKSETADATDITIEIIERFDAYERGNAPTVKAPTNMVEALTLALEQQKALEAKDQEIATLAPKAEALEELASLDGQHSLRDAAKQCGWTERAFVQKLQELHWVYPTPVTGRKCAYADKVKAGLMDVKNVPIVRSGGQTEGVGQPMITQKGIARLRVILGVQPGKVRPFAKKQETATV